jgi:hypothetical protein
MDISEGTDGQDFRGVFDGCALPLAVISLATLVPSYVIIRNYFNGDDFAYIHFFHTISRPGILRLFHTDMAQVLWKVPAHELRPMYGLYFMLSYQLWGVHPAGYHAVSLLLHVFNCMLVFRIVREVIPQEPWRGLSAALLFAVLPLDSDVFFWATGAPAELLPAFLYLAAFWGFLRFRAARSPRYLVIVVAAFAGCLLSKESGVTLPAILVAYDCIAGLSKNAAHRDEKGDASKVRELRLYAPLIALLVAYLTWRRISFGSFLNEGTWGAVWHGSEYVPNTGMGRTTFFSQLLGLQQFLLRLQALNIRHLVLPFPPLVLILALTCYGYWTVSFWNRRGQCRPTHAPLLFFGILWYAITTLPLLAANATTYHLYLPAVGWCIAMSLLAFPACGERSSGAGQIRVLSFSFLIIISASQLWRNNALWAQREKISETQLTALRTALQSASSRTLVVIWPGRTFQFLDDTFPYPLQPPFANDGVYGRRNVVVDPFLYGARAEWFQVTRSALSANLGGPPRQQSEMLLVSWNAATNRLQQQRQTVSISAIQTSISKSLDNPESQLEWGERDGASLVEALSGLVRNGVPQSTSLISH